MEIPYTVKARPDTGLWNAKIGVWLFLASEVMLFGGLFSGYIFMRLGAEPGTWPRGLLNVPVGTFNTFILILSSVTVVFAWAALKMRNFRRYQICMGTTILCALLFLGIKLGYEWPVKFHHFGADIKAESLAKYEEYLGNEHRQKEGLPPRLTITGYLLDEHGHSLHQADYERLRAEGVKELRVKLDAVNADPNNPENDNPRFLPAPVSDKIATIATEDIRYASMFLPRRNAYFATYYTITGLHGIHVIGGIIVFIYFMLPVSTRLYRKDPEHLANRVETAGLFWHFVDLVWIFAFPIFYLL